MTATTKRFWLARGGELVAAAILLALLPEPPRGAGSLVTALAFGVVVALALFPFALLLRPTTRLMRPAVTAGVAAYLVARAAVEEVVWRLAVTGRLAAAVGWASGLAAGTLGFALAHSGGRAPVLAHACTGLAFGSLYLLTGQLLAAITAHAVYNLLVLGATARRA